MKTRYCILVALSCAILVGAVAAFNPAGNGFGFLVHRRPAQEVDTAQAYRKIAWYELVPRDWNPAAHRKGKSVAANLSDSSPEARALLQDLRAVWDNAPTVDAMNGAAVKLTGYVVPLESNAGELREFLLVPYFGACIHTPPPPANQIIHVFASKPAKGFGSMAAVRVSGTLKTHRRKSDIGASGYEMEMASIEAYVPPSRP